jgi:hypothetical protein
VVPWEQGGNTDIDNMALACDFHHDQRAWAGWRITMINGRPWAIPPPWIDPDQTAVRNTMHDLAPVG